MGIITGYLFIQITIFIIKQLIDIAMLAAGQLKGEALAKFVNRSVELL